MALTLSIIVGLVFIIINFYKNILLVSFFIIFVISSFSLVFLFGSAMPLRTMQAIPLFIAGVWLIIYRKVDSKRYKKIIFCIVIVMSYINIQYITRITYGDNMRLEYDKNFANQIYNHITVSTGDAINKKPLVIIGKHSYVNKPFIIKSDYDTIGYSFFEWDAGNPVRIHKFMSWLGYEYIYPSNLVQESALEQSFRMPNYPAKGSLRETESYIILKLSSSK
jgi:hypothetical protein